MSHCMPLEAILQAAKLFHIIPVHCVRAGGSCSCCKHDCQYPGKHPAISDWHNKATQDAATIHIWHKATGGP